MKKTTILVGFTLALLILTLTPALASYHYSYDPNNNYGYPNYNSYPTHNAPTITDRANSINEGSSSYNRNYQGPIIQRDTKYDEFLKIGKSGRVLRTISSTTSERYVGGTQVETANTQNKNNYNRDYTSIPNNPAYYSESSYFRSLPRYNYLDYGSDRYGKSYYYEPRYDDNKGFYNWRY